MSKQPRVVVLGSLVLDYVARAARLPRPGETVLGEAFGVYPGGKGANQATQAVKLGAVFNLMGGVGADAAGERLLAELGSVGVSTDFVCRDPAAKTAACCIHVDAQGRNAIVIVPEANAACCPEDVDAARNVIRAADVFITQLEIPLETVARGVTVAAGGPCVILNPAPAQRLPPALLRHIDLLVPNESEAEFLTGVTASGWTGDRPGHSSWEAHVSSRLREEGAQRVLLTLGEKGTYISGPNQETLVPSFRVDAVDTTAAGDAFCGALAVALAEGRALRDAVRFANAAGAVAVTRPGAQPSMGTRREIEDLLAGSQLAG